MSIGNINVEELLERVKKALKEDTSISEGLRTSIEMMMLVISLLVNRLGLNSKNSSKPPSSDPNRDKKKREKTGRKPGGQNGRKGATLTPVEDPDEIEEIKVDRSQLPEGKYETVGYEARQIFEIDISVVVTEYRAEILKDETGHKIVAKFPDGVNSRVQYGNGVRAHSVYLSQYQLLPYDRASEWFEEQMGLPLSVGTINNINQKCYEMLESFEEKLKAQLLLEKVLHADETGINIGGKRHWLHGNTNKKWTYLYAHKKRGKEAMDEMGVLPHFRGRLCHDHWKPYYRYEHIIHSLCNSHHLRELERVWEQDKQEWGKTMIQFLTELNEEVNGYGGKLPEGLAQVRSEEYQEILQEAENQCPAPKPPPDGSNKKGRQARSKARNLLERLQGFENDVLRFMYEEDIPFTNNQGERDIRMTKVHQKISGCFRSEEGAKVFCRIRSYLASARKQGISAAVALNAVFEGRDIFADAWGC